MNTPLPTSTACESLFCTSGLLFSPRRAKTNDSNFENQHLFKLSTKFHHSENKMMWQCFWGKMRISPDCLQAILLRMKKHITGSPVSCHLTLLSNYLIVFLPKTWCFELIAQFVVSCAYRVVHDIILVIFRIFCDAIQSIFLGKWFQQNVILCQFHSTHKSPHNNRWF